MHVRRQGMLFIRDKDKTCFAVSETTTEKNPVTLVSTFYNAINTLNGKPRVIGAYNTFMGGVDLSDQMIGAYNDHRKCSKVWKKFIYHIFHRIMLNAYILYSHNTSLPVMTRLQFNQSVIESLASDYLTHRYGYVNRQTRVKNLMVEKKEIVLIVPTESET
ncbi:unnamed protein product [Mytilus edulis]|uniref:PiggyBac transposable element-derived protein domain-containing protein n=1 Tax=Mytilus edulis TaxID=6550 RepID=A0A8S3TRH6_MYTED|nr:unnamed protein product [Mytilus edulis]